MSARRKLDPATVARAVEALPDIHPDDIVHANIIREHAAATEQMRAMLRRQAKKLWRRLEADGYWSEEQLRRALKKAKRR